MDREKFYEKVKSMILGHAAGDAVGGPVQFEGRSKRDSSPVTDMMPFGDPNLPKGAWSDDTSMALCAMDALTRHGLDFRAVMENFQKWLDEGKFTPTGLTFDIGIACLQAVDEFSRETFSAEGHGRCGENENGNGSLMRIYPFSLYLYRCELPSDWKISCIHRASALTHAHPRSCIGCGIYSFVVWELLSDPTKRGIKDGLKRAKEYYQGEPELKYYHRLFDEGFELLPREKIKSSGYVVDTLEAAIWCVLTTENYRDCILKAVNLGLDTDTVGAVAGSLAGLLYGVEGIPEDWRDSLLKKDYLEKIGQEFCDTLCGPMPRSEFLKFRRIIKDGPMLGFFYIIGEDRGGGEVTDKVICNGNSPYCWHSAEKYPFRGEEDTVVIFAYRQNTTGDTAANGLAFTTYRNYKKYINALPDGDISVPHFVAPFWDYTAIYKMPDFPTFREARNYLIDQFGSKSENILEWSGNEDRKYPCGPIQ